MDITNEAPTATDIKRSWSFTADITDPAGIDSGTVVIKIDGATISPTLTTITDGYRAEYAPSTASSYGQRINVEVSADVTGGTTETTSWRFTTTTGMATATSSPPPEVMVIKDISLIEQEADEIQSGIYVVWLREITHPLIVTEEQAEAVGKVAVENNTYNRHKRTIKVDRTDDNSDLLTGLSEGDLIAFTASALGETVKKAEVVAIKQIIDDLDISYILSIQYFEVV